MEIPESLVTWWKYDMTISNLLTPPKKLIEKENGEFWKQS